MRPNDDDSVSYIQGNVRYYVDFTLSMNGIWIKGNLPGTIILELLLIKLSLIND